MKKLVFAVLLTTGLALGALAQDKVNEKDVPTAIQSKFKKEFPNAKDVEWKMKDGKYKAAFEINGLDHTAAFDTDGKMMSKGMKIRVSELPTAVTDAVKGSYANRSIDDAFRIDKDGAAHYLVKLDGTPETKILYSANGQVVNDKMD